MRKINGITINGEYLGNSVVINGMFRAICTISPIIMRDFVQIINKIEKFDEAVRIHNFNCGFDCIDIEFCNNKSTGIASLYFKLINGSPELTNCTLIIDGREYSTFQEKITLPVQSDNDMSETSTMNGEEYVQITGELDNNYPENLNQAEAIRRKKLNNAVGVNDSTDESELALSQKDEELSDDEPMNLRRRRLSERKKRMIDAKKSAIQDGSNDDTETDHSTDFAGISSDNYSTIDSMILSKSDGDSSSKRSEGAVSDSGQTAVNSAGGNNLSKSDSDISSNISDGTVFAPEQAGVNSDVSAGGTNVRSANNNDNNSKPMASSKAFSRTGRNDNNNSAYEFNENDIDVDMSGGYDDIGDYGDNVHKSKKKKYGKMAHDDFEDMSDDEFNDQWSKSEVKHGGSDIPASNNYNGISDAASQGLDSGFAESLTQGIAQSLKEGLTEGLAGLIQVLSQMGLGGIGNGMGSQSFGGGNGMDNQSFDGGNGMDNQSFDGGNGNGMNSGALSEQQGFSPSGYNGFGAGQNFGSPYPPQYNQFPPNYGMNPEAAMMAQASYPNNPNQKAVSEVDMLKEELEMLKSLAENKKDLMTLDEFLAKQRELEEVKEQRNRQRLNIVGSRGRVNASALDGGVFVSGKKVYKWGDTKVLDE